VQQYSRTDRGYDNAVNRGEFGPKRAPDRCDGLVQGIIKDGKVYISLSVHHF
jgi:hypothetical protein